MGLDSPVSEHVHAWVPAGRKGRPGLLAIFGLALLGSSAAYADCGPSAATVTCTGALGNVAITYPTTTTLNVNSLTADMILGSGIGVSLKGIQPAGANGAGHDLADGDNGTGGAAGPGLSVYYDGGAHLLSTTGAAGIVSISRGGDGGNGGFSGNVDADGGNGASGGVGGHVYINSAGAITTSGDNAYGVLGQSIGGNGGNGGDAEGVDADGGNGGSAAGGGEVEIDNASAITTDGTSAHGIYAQSVGGHGGSGGDGDGISGDGGDGGTTAPGGVIDVDNTGAITTHGSYSYGILGQSVGGFGGSGGDGGGLVAFGSSGASAGAGGIVGITNSGTIETDEIGSHGIFAQSVGGGGGDGGSAGGLVALGAGGSTGGAGGAVTVTTTGSGHITTLGDDARGIYAQSLGGGGGDGGSSAGLATIGGSGSATSAGGDVTVSNTQAITTSGNTAQAIFAQSIGGGGGNGGTTYGLISIGGSAGSGGDAGIVKVGNIGALSTGGDDSAAIFAQSVGGGGGNGGGAYAFGAGFSVAIGGAGAAGGDGKDVTVNETSDVNTLAASSITTTGDRSHGIEAQSIGGGGGNGGFAFSGSLDTTGFSASVALGGTGGPGGGTGIVTVNDKGTIATGGATADGILAQSIGGGGGNGGGSVAVAAASAGYALGLTMGGHGGSGGAASAVDVNFLGGITTTGELSNGIFAQSVGGGGGNGGFAVSATAGALAGSVALGGGAGVGGIGGDVTVDVAGITGGASTIKTTRDGSVGIFAQSVGGGGGNGGFAGTLGVGGGALGIGLGGKGASGAMGGEVTVDNADIVTTDGDNAAGIEAQSVGGGGGNGGFAVSGTGGVISGAVAVGGAGGGGSNGNTVDVDNDGAITTKGKLSYGILAQSVGGGGGNGGFAISGALGVSVPDVPGGAAAVSIGGTGGGASKGETVTVDNSGNIETFGLGAHALFAQSIGGGGGNGGFAGSVAMTLGEGAAFAVSVGGTGGGGGDGGEVDVTSTGATIKTHAAGADGVRAQSVGGGGGDGGFAFSGAFGFSEETNVNVAVSVGGHGGTGGIGALVDVDTSSAITTDGDFSNGVMAQSIGGGGGSGGLAVSGNLGISETPGNVGVTVGGFAGNGSTGGIVEVTNSGAIVTGGDNSLGILAQSVGGSGGNGGLAITAQLTGATKDSGAVGVTVGGGGGNGNSGGKVTVENEAAGSITTTGLDSHGIEAQSIGGGGGNGGMAITAQLGKAGGTEDEESKTLNAAVTIGGKGGVGGFGGEVDVTNDGAIDVTGENAMGIEAQSIGGGGGNGGAAVSAMGLLTDKNNPDSRTVTATVSIGGGGGDGNYGGVVSVTNSGAITTHGGSGYGVFAQSIGGGGGIGGQANTLNVAVAAGCSLPGICDAPESNKNNMSLGVTVGGNGGSASNGGFVKVDNTGTVETFGSTADAIYAQSVGGSGGNGGNGVLGSGGLLPFPAEMAAIPVGSISFKRNIQVAVGGSAGSEGDGGMVEVDNDRNVTTHGDDSNGIFAQSVGGGGGVGGKGVIGATGTLGIGGKGGAAGDGEKVTVKQTGDATIETFGVASNGIFAQSVGGGGGVAGDVDRALAHPIDAGPVTIPGLNLGLGVGIGQNAGGGGDGGPVEVTVDGNIVTYGDNAAGIFAESVGGGGGLLGELGNDVPVLDLLSWHIGSNGDAGSAQKVTVDLTGDIRTAGNNATGIFAQSSGGQGTAGEVDITVNGSIETAALLASGDGTADAPVRGLGSAAIIAQSVAASAANDNDINVTIEGADSVVSGGHTKVLDQTRGYAGVGVWMIDGKSNTLTNHGTVTTADGADGLAVLGSGSDATHLGGNDSVDNYGTVTGAVDLGVGANGFTNELGSTFNSGLIAMLGTGNLLSNSGTMSPGGIDRVMKTTVTGNYTQDAQGTYAANIDLAATGTPGASDLLETTGALDMAGKVDLTLLNIGNALPGQHVTTIATADTAFDGTGVTLESPATAVARYALSSDANNLLVSYGIDFSPEGLNPNQATMGQYINLFQLAGGSTSIEPVVQALFNLPDIESYGKGLDQLSPEPYVVNAVADMLDGLQFENALMSCRVFDGVNKFSAEGECAWAQAGAHHTSRAADADNPAYTATELSLSGGFQTKVDGNFHAGLAGSIDGLASSAGDGSASTGQRGELGTVVKGVFGDTVLALSLTGGYSGRGVTRAIDLPGGPSYVLQGDQSIAFASGHVRLSHAFAAGNVYLRPLLDAGVTATYMPGFVEQGGGPVALEVDAATNVFVTVEPALELGGELALGPDLVARPYLRAGLLDVASGADPSVSARFSGAPGGVQAFTVNGSVDALQADVTAGIDLVTSSNMALRASGDAKIGRTTQSYGGNLKFSAPF